MATLIDERTEKEEDNTGEQISQLTAEPELQETPQEDIPDKYKGKSTADIVRMHQEAEKLLGRQSSEVGELRSVVDNYIQTQLDTTTQATPEPEEESYSCPEGTINNMGSQFITPGLTINCDPEITNTEVIDSAPEGMWVEICCDPEPEGLPPLPSKDKAPLKGKPKMDPQIARMQTLAKIPKKL